MSETERQEERCLRLIALADEVISTYEAPAANVFAAGWVDAEKFRQWRSGSLTFLEDLLGDSTYLAEFRVATEGGSSSGTTPVREGKGVLVAVFEDLQAGFLTSVRRLIRAEVFTDFLDMAEHLHESGYHHAAVSLTGAVLEDGLRQIAEAASVKANRRDDLSGLNSNVRKSPCGLISAMQPTTESGRQSIRHAPAR
jgi:hypothetical protein